MDVIYEIYGGEFPINVILVPLDGSPPYISQDYFAPEVDMFSDVPFGNYILQYIDGNGSIFVIDYICCDPPCFTTTTTIEPTTTTSTTVEATTTTTIEQTTTTTSTTVETTTTTLEVVTCLENITIECIYLDNSLDLQKIQVYHPEYVHPCPEKYGFHYCNRALFEVYGNGIWLGDSMMNNLNGEGGGQTVNSGNFICQDYYNTPSELTGGVWEGHYQARYSKITLTYEQSMAVAQAGGGGSVIHFSFIGANTEESFCDGDKNPHEDVTWIRITSSVFGLLYNGCPQGQFFNLEVCGGAITTTTTTTIYTPPTSTTTTTSLIPVVTTTTTTIGIETVFIHIPNLPPPINE